MTGCTEEWSNTMTDSTDRLEAADSLLGTRPTALGKAHSEHKLGVAVGRMKYAEGGGSGLKHDVPSTVSRVCHSLLLKHQGSPAMVGGP